MSKYTWSAPTNIRTSALVHQEDSCQRHRKFRADATFLGAPIRSATLEACAAACNATLLCVMPHGLELLDTFARPSRSRPSRILAHDIYIPLREKSVILHNKYRQCFLLQTPYGAEPDDPRHGSVACTLRQPTRAPKWQLLGSFLQQARPLMRTVGRDTMNAVLAAAEAHEENRKMPRLPVRRPAAKPREKRSAKSSSEPTLISSLAPPV